jgi:putative DNA methylase
MRPTALEVAFPIQLISESAEKEAWRKEVHRPATHTHKWWAQRLGSVFRGIIASALADDEGAAKTNYSSLIDRPEITVLDPFAGSGTTLFEAAKMGCRVIGYDINPVASLVQRQSLAGWDRNRLEAAYKEVEEAVRHDIDQLHVDSAGRQVLYYFWVTMAMCPTCPDGSAPVELFSRYVFAQHAYVKKYPTAHAVCPNCYAVVKVDLSRDDMLGCTRCGRSGSFEGPVSGAYMTCKEGHRSKILQALDGKAPDRKMFAKLVLTKEGKRQYQPIDDFDEELYRVSERLLERADSNLVLPAGSLANGYNTRQAISWGYREWSSFFNARQLYSLGRLGAAIRDLPQSPEREALAALFSGVLEFNNLFCSYKGEGTGAVRHMFSHHILKPERVPLEAHPWGTPASSGSFSTLFKSRIIRALDYKQEPFDLVGNERKFNLSKPVSLTPVESYAEFSAGPGAALIVTRSAASMDIPDKSVDLVITDPPYFDNVHYSELADFFHAWLRGIRPFASYPVDSESTRTSGEVQSADAIEFSDAIEAVWRDCARVMKDHGLLAFTFHQARPAGWSALVTALKASGLIVTAVQPVKGEMSVAAPKSGASDPSNLDSIIVCRKLGRSASRPTLSRVLDELEKCRSAGVLVGWSDVQSVVRGVVLSEYTDPDCTFSLDELLTRAQHQADSACDWMGIVSRRTTS